ncbi:MAG TPA: glucose 1-dehydrogenase [Spirochaetia bacterium]|nr:glucose 1-dehydrogenase [Spirochaetia bacterium]
MTEANTTGTGIIDRFRLDGKVALVTGGGQGIGRGYAHALAEAGAKVAVVDINLGAAETVAHELEAGHHPAIALKADVTKEADVVKMVASIVGQWRSLAIGVNNAGIGKWADAVDIPFEDWRSILSINLDAVFLCARTEAREMMKSGYGKMINTASMSAHIVNMPQSQAAYNASKAGVLHLTRSLAAEWAVKGIRVNSISPGYTRTKLVNDLLATPVGADMLPKWLSMIPMGRMAEVEDLQGAVVFLASPASDYMTGQDIIIDGGYCCW